MIGLDCYKNKYDWIGYACFYNEFPTFLHAWECQMQCCLFFSRMLCALEIALWCMHEFTLAFTDSIFYGVDAF